MNCMMALQSIICVTDIQPALPDIQPALLYRPMRLRHSAMAA